MNKKTIIGIIRKCEQNRYHIYDTKRYRYKVLSFGLYRLDLEDVNTTWSNDLHNWTKIAEWK